MLSPSYRRKSEPVAAKRWFKHGDHELVRPWPRSSYPSVCPMCRVLLTDHGYTANVRGTLRVCPGDWVVVDSRGKIRIATDEDFKRDYEQT